LQQSESKSECIEELKELIEKDRGAADIRGKSIGSKAAHALSQDEEAV